MTIYSLPHFFEEFSDITEWKKSSSIIEPWKGDLASLWGVPSHKQRLVHSGNGFGSCAVNTFWLEVDLPDWKLVPVLLLLYDPVHCLNYNLHSLVRLWRDLSMRWICWTILPRSAKWYDPQCVQLLFHVTITATVFWAAFSFRLKLLCWDFICVFFPKVIQEAWSSGLGRVSRTWDISSTFLLNVSRMEIVKFSLHMVRFELHEVKWYLLPLHVYIRAQSYSSYWYRKKCQKPYNFFLHNWRISMALECDHSCF